VESLTALTLVFEDEATCAQWYTHLVQARLCEYSDKEYTATTTVVPAGKAEKAEKAGKAGKKGKGEQDSKGLKGSKGTKSEEDEQKKREKKEKEEDKADKVMDGLYSSGIF
jgi:hypothetical protein